MSATRLHCLIVEGHSTSALSLKAALSTMGFATFGFASTAPQAVAAAKTRKPDLVITSMSLSGVAEDIVGTPVIYLAGEVADSDAHACDIVLQRPVGRAALASAWETLRGETVAAA